MVCTLDIQIAPQKVFYLYGWGVQVPSQHVFGCLGICIYIYIYLQYIYI